MAEFIDRVSSRMRRSQSLRLVTVGILVLLLQIPVAMIGGLISERETRGTEAALEISSKWGNRQTVIGPVLAVPYTHRSTFTAREGVKTEVLERRFGYFLPEQLTIAGTVTSEIRERGIFPVPVYRLELTMAGRFARPDFAALGVRPVTVDWERAHLVLGISDMRAIQEETAVDWSGHPVAFLPGTGGFAALAAGMHAPVGMAADATGVSFSLPLALNGSGGAYFTPFGRSTVVELSSNYPHPSFQGNWLPNERSVTDAGFEARWSIPFLGRSFPQAWTSAEGPNDAIADSAFGVDLLEPVDHYRMAERSVKYASLFILLTFAALWLFEVRAGVRVHPIQFLMLGGALCLFYLLLLALSEHLAFGLAYALASVAVIAMVAAYGMVVLRGTSKALAVGVAVALLYAYLYVLLVNEDYALLIGAVGLFAILGLIMYATRNVDWYGTRTAEEGS